MNCLACTFVQKNNTMAHKSYEESIKDVYKGLILLAVVTLIEVFISLLGKGHLGIDVSGSSFMLGLISIGLIVFSLYKAYFIIFQFMHMAHEAKGLAWTVLLPTILLVWAVIAFFQEGNSWKERREADKAGVPFDVDQAPEQESFNLQDDIYVPNLG